MNTRSCCLALALAAGTLVAGCAADAESDVTSDALSASAPSDAAALVGYALDCIYVVPGSTESHEASYAFFEGPSLGGNGAGEPNRYVQRRQADLPGGSDIGEYQVDRDGTIWISHLGPAPVAANEGPLRPTHDARGALAFERTRRFQFERNQFDVRETCSFQKAGVAPFQGTDEEKALVGKKLGCTFAEAYGRGRIDNLFFAAPNGRPTVYSRVRFDAESSMEKPTVSQVTVRSYFGDGTFGPYSVKVSAPDADPTTTWAGTNVIVGKEHYNTANPSHVGSVRTGGADGIDLTCSID